MEWKRCFQEGALCAVQTPTRQRCGGHRGIHRRVLRQGQKRGAKVGKCRAGKATKVMAIADRHGLPISISIADGSRHDVALTDQALDEAFVDKLPPHLIGDKAWDSAKHQKKLKSERGIELIAPMRKGKRPSKRKQDGRRARRYKRRWKVERLFAWLHNFRRLVVRWEHKDTNFLGFLQLGCVVILLRYL